MPVSCKICGSTNLDRKHNRIRDGAKEVDCNVWKCIDCEIVFLDMDIDEHQLLDYYKDGHFRDSYLPDIKDAESKKAEKFYSLKQPLQESRLNSLRDLFKEDMEVLDVGCATAGFLDLLKDLVGRVKGIELYRPHVEYARGNLGLDVEMKNINDIAEEKFDVICTFQVMEHVAKPVDFLSQIYKRLKDNGLLIIEVPNIDDPLISLYDVTPYKDFYFMKPHLFYYSETSIASLLKKIGFNSVQFRSFQHYGLMNHLCWSLTGETSTATKVGGGGMSFPSKFLDSPALEAIMPFFEDTNRKYKTMLEEMRKTDTLLVIARKE